MNNEIYSIKESRFLILFLLIIMVILAVSVGSFIFILLKDADVFSQNFHIQFEFLITICIIGTKDAFFASLILLKKLFFPCSLKFTKQGFFCSELKQFINWNQIEEIEYLNYNKMFFKKSNLLSYFLCMLVVKNIMGVTFDFLKQFLLSGGDSKVLIIKTPVKKELLENSDILKKFENSLLPDNFIQLEIAIDLAVVFPQDKTEKDVVSVLREVQTTRI